MAGVQAFFDGTGREWEAEQRVLHRDGTERWHLMRGVVERGANGRVTRFTGTSIDISDRKLMERELSDSEERFRRTFENAAVGMILTDIDGNLLEYNRRFCEFLGYSAEELAGRRLFELMDPNEAVLHRETQERIVRGEAPVFTRDSRYFRKDGAVVWGTLTLSVIQHHPDGTPLHVMGILQDITERKALEATLELATRLSRVYSWSFELEDGKINNARATLVNVWESLGYDSPPEAAQFESAMTLVILPEDQPAVWGAVFACLEGRMPQFEAEYRIRHADGSIHWNLGRGIVTRDTSGRPLRFLGTSVDITELKRVQDEARKNKERLELAVLGSRACTWDFDLVDGTIANARAAYTNVWELLGYAEAAPSGSFGDGLASLIHPEEQAQFVARVQSFLDGTQHRFESEVRCRFIDGSDRWQLARGVVDRDARGRVVRFTGSSVDITDRKEMESVVHESEARFRRTFENAAVGMILTDTNGEFLEYNRRFCEFLGYSPDELARRCLLDFMGPDAAALHVECQQRVVRGETPTFTHDTRYLCKDGAVVWGNLTVSIIQRRADGTPLQLMAILQDITERRTLEAEIRQARETLELAMRGSDISVVVIDVPDGAPRESRQTFFDHESRRLFFNFWEPMGIDPAAAPASFEDWTRLSIHPEDYEAVLGNFRAVAESREPEWAIEHRFFRADGSVRWRLSRGTILYDGEGNVSRYLATAIDITTLKQIEGELSRAREAAEAANRAKDEFLANVSHEIRTPMNAILGMTELALDSTPSAHQRQLLSTVRSAAKNLLGIINDLLDFSKISAGKLTLDRAPFSLRAAVGDTLRALAVRAHRKGLEFSCHVSPEVPDALDGDAGRLRQVLMNLVGNAIKFTQSGQVEVDVAPSTGASLETEDVYLVFSVRDTGIGIALERQVSIFRAFEQGDSSTTRNYGGTGLGLTIAAQLVALMSGSVTVESAPGHGSKFRFSTRFARSKRPESATSLPELLADLRVLGVEDDATNRRLDLTPPSMVAPSVEPQLSFRILVAEDNEFNVALLEELLRRRGHRGEFARDGRAALELALNHVPAEIFDLMLLDLHMPGLDGFEVARVIRDHEQGTSQHLPIIALTARSSAHDRERCIAAGMDEFLSKPVEAAVLWAMMERLVRRWSPAVGVPRQAKLRVLEPRSILRACDGEASLLERILVLFRQSLPNHMSQVRTALGVGDLATLREAAHRLAGTVGAFSTVTADIALTLEDEAVRQDLESCTALVERLGSMCEALLEETATLSIDSLNL
jgi:PAS domain S-box-containing protein